MLLLDIQDLTQENVECWVKSTMEWWKGNDHAGNHNPSCILHTLGIHRHHITTTKSSPPPYYYHHHQIITSHYHHHHHHHQAEREYKSWVLTTRAHYWGNHNPRTQVVRWCHAVPDRGGGSMVPVTRLPLQAFTLSLSELKVQRDLLQIMTQSLLTLGQQLASRSVAEPTPRASLWCLWESKQKTWRKHKARQVACCVEVIPKVSILFWHSEFGATWLCCAEVIAKSLHSTLGQLSLVLHGFEPARNSKWKQDYSNTIMLAFQCHYPAVHESDLWHKCVK